MLAAMKVMVLGATGFIGPPLVRALSAMGHETVAVARTPSAGVLALERGDAAAVARAAQGCEAVVDLLAMTLPATAPLLDALAGRIGRYVLASSGDVYLQYGALNRLEAAGELLRRIPEDAPLRTRLYPYRAATRRPAEDPAAWMDDYDKIPIEQAAQSQAGLSSVVARLPMVWGPGDRQRRFAWAIAPMLAGATALDMDDQWADWRTTYGYVDDVANGLALAATHPDARGAYNLGAAEAPDHAHWAERFAAAAGWTGAFRRLPREAAGPARRQRLDQLDLSVPMVTDTSRIRAELGFCEVTDPTDGLDRTLSDEARRLAG
ncbi:MAG TPA: NAD-dependent epimerase/dehydratase family protein [Phenylobacterium sp.]|jgi:nucleoside-diphosphate-sugar epimerase